MTATLVRYVATQWRFLTFRSAPIAATERTAFLGFALVATWIAGLGRYWDHEKPHVVQSLGLGSVAYVFVFTSLLWIVGLPLKPRAWRFSDVLLFVAMTSPLAWLYAVPVERFMTVELAAAANAVFLTIVAAWRVALLVRHLHVVCGLGEKTSLVTAFLPLTAIVVALTALNLEHATFNLMSSGGGATPHDAAYQLVIVLTVGSVIAVVPLLLAYAFAIDKRANARKAAADAAANADAAAEDPPPSQ